MLGSSLIFSSIIGITKTLIIAIVKLLIGVFSSPTVWTFVQSRIRTIPRYIRLLLLIYNAEKGNSEKHRKITITLLLLSTILSAIASNFLIIGIPIIGIFTEAIALLVTVAIILASMEILIKTYGDEYLHNVKDINIKEDLQQIEKLLGPTWHKLIKELENIYTTLSPVIENNFKEISQHIESYFKANLQDLCIYINPLQGTEITFTKSNIKKIGQSLDSWQKTAVSLAEGSLTGSAIGLGASSVASSIFVQSTVFTSLASVLGINTGIAVSASAFAMLTVGLPVTLAAASAGGIMYYGFKKRSADEQERESKFFSNSILSIIPMAYTDGNFCQIKKDTIHQLTNNYRIKEEDHQRIYQAINNNKYQTFEEICEDNLLMKYGSSNAEIQHTFVLYLAWELAKVDGVIHPKEIELFERMAYILKINPEVYRKIQGIVTPEFIQKARYDVPFNLNKDYLPFPLIMDNFIN